MLETIGSCSRRFVTGDLGDLDQHFTGATEGAFASPFPRLACTPKLVSNQRLPSSPHIPGRCTRRRRS